MKFWILAAGLALGACGGSGAEVRPAAHIPVPTAALPANVGAILGQTGNAMIARFGKPQLDIVEGRGRKLQFAGPICVLDAYLYPAANGRGDPTVTYLDTRQRDGGPIDQASCVAALGKR
ncbi:hypothetical protein [Sphingomonas sp. M1-B02]|uniref:hypothetical protein n=1 Tax=Sphingomonas sp. M1-B02 TaxID=3114300 RepID=UPI00223FE298|nr:hypothetical protein [Sphingomonas sp. S6-11]UZK67644.1 hypothetical protein OKW87_07400 [Sphingomonas sp. S6-11]